MLLLSLCLPCFAAGPIGTQYGQPYGDDNSVYLNDQVAQALADTGAGFVRVNIRRGGSLTDTPQWYAAYDGIIDRLRSRGVEVIGLLTNEAWPGGSSDWTANAYETTGGNGWNPYLDNWCSFFLRASTHWQGKIKYWELWNEPDCLAVIYPSNYGALLAHSYDLVHTNNVPVEIISGGVCGGVTGYGADFVKKTYDVSINNTGWFAQMKTKWGTYPLDYIGFHLYPNYNTTLNQSYFSTYMDDFHTAYLAYEGADTTKKMWLTEIGWDSRYVSDTRQASNLTNMCKVASGKSYVRGVTQFYLKDEPAASLYFGLFRSTGLAEADKKPSWAALKTACTYEGRWSAGGTIDQPILDYFNANGHASMGNPYNDDGTAWVHSWDFGPVQDYDGGTGGKMMVFDASDGRAYSVREPFLTVVNTNHAALEFPLSDQFSAGNGLKQSFEGGYVTWTQADGASASFYTYKPIKDNADGGFAASGTWTTTSAGDAYAGNYRSRKGTTTNSDPAVWTVPISQTGAYDVYVRYPTVTGAAAAASYEIVHSTGTATVTVNQQARSGRWNRLGSYTFAAGNVTIRLSSQGGSTENILADAVRLVLPVANLDPTPPTPPVVTDEGPFTKVTNKLNASWVSEDRESGIDHYEYAIGNTAADPGTGYVAPWTSTGTTPSASASLTLLHAKTYYFYVKAFNNVGLVSEGISHGITVDLSPPVRPTVALDGDFTADPQALHFAWSSSDPESGIAYYEYSVGTATDGAATVPLTNTGTSTQAWVTGLSLSAGTSYFVSVRATNAVGLKSAYNNPVSIRYQAGREASRIADARSWENGTTVLLKDKTVSGCFLGRFYLEDADRSSGIAIISSGVFFDGATVDVSGTLGTLDGERVLITGSVTPERP